LSFRLPFSFHLHSFLVWFCSLTLSWCCVTKSFLIALQIGRPRHIELLCLLRARHLENHLYYDGICPSKGNAIRGVGIVLVAFTGDMRARIGSPWDGWCRPCRSISTGCQGRTMRSRDSLGRRSPRMEMTIMRSAPRTVSVTLTRPTSGRMMAGMAFQWHHARK